MATSNITRIVRGAVGKGGVMYNDKLKSGVRSIKAWGWVEADYDAAAAALRAAGYTVRKVKFTQWSNRVAMHYTQTRLHVG